MLTPNETNTSKDIGTRKDANAQKADGSKSVNLNFDNDFVAPLFAITAVVALLIVRGALFYFESGDYLWAFRLWVDEFRGMTFFQALGSNVGNYNPPYMYILNIISRIGISDLYLIKAVSIIFDFIIAFFVMKLVSLRTKSRNMHILAFVLAFAIPTVVINSSMWGQCDSIFAAFALGSIYFALSERSKLAFAFIAIALSIKLPAAFILPMFAVFVMVKKIRLRDCYVFFLTYIAMLLPAIIAGRSLGDIFSVYFGQPGTFLSLNMNIVNIWRFIGDVEFANFRLAGLFIAGAAVLGLLYFTYVNRKNLVQTVDFIRLAFLFAAIVPFLLPQMHDRYFYMADVLSLVVFLYDKRRWYVPVVTVFCSYLAYVYYLLDFTVLLDYRYAAIALFVVIIIVLRDYVTSLYPGKEVHETR